MVIYRLNLRETSKTRKARLFEAKCTLTYTSKKNASLTKYYEVYIRFNAAAPNAPALLPSVAHSTLTGA